MHVSTARRRHGSSQPLTNEATIAASSHPKVRLATLMIHLAITNRPAAKIMISEVRYSLHPWSSAPLLGNPIPRSRIIVATGRRWTRREGRCRSTPTWMSLPDKETHGVGLGGTVALNKPCRLRLSHNVGPGRLCSWILIRLQGAKPWHHFGNAFERGTTFLIVVGLSWMLGASFESRKGKASWRKWPRNREDRGRRGASGIPGTGTNAPLIIHICKQAAWKTLRVPSVPSPLATNP